MVAKNLGKFRARLQRGFIIIGSLGWTIVVADVVVRLLGLSSWWVILFSAFSLLGLYFVGVLDDKYRIIHGEQSYMFHRIPQVEEMLVRLKRIERMLKR